MAVMQQAGDLALITRCPGLGTRNSAPVTEHSALPAIELELATPAFSGPLALLLELIERRKLPITEVSLSEVADQYLERMRSLVGLRADILADFLAIGAKLLLIKSRALLPDTPIEQEGLDEAADLQQRLLEYRIFRDAAGTLGQLVELGRRSYPRQAPLQTAPRPEPPLEPIPPEMLRAAMQRMLRALRPEAEPLSLPPRVSVEERMAYVVSRLAALGRATFSDLSGPTVDSIVATFLALLELLRRGRVTAEQEAPFGEIHLALLRTEE